MTSVGSERLHDRAWKAPRRRSRTARHPEPVVAPWPGAVRLGLLFGLTAGTWGLVAVVARLLL